MKTDNPAAKKTVGKSVTIVLLMAMCIAFFTCRDNNTAQTRESETVISRAEVITSPVSRGPIFKAYTAVGAVAPEDMARILPKVSGRIASIDVDEGDFVKQGQVLMQIDTFEYEWAVQNAQALAKQARANLNKSKRDFARMSKLHKSRAVSDQVFEDARTARDVAMFTYDQAEAGLKIAKRNLKECTVSAPISGVLTSKFVNEGELTSPQNLSFVIMLMDTVKVEVDLPEEAFSFIETGNRSFVTADAIPGETFEGVITKIYPTIDPASRTFKVTLSLDNPGLRLRAGMTARARVIQKARENSIFASSDAFISGEKGYFVFRVEDDIVEKVHVRTGIVGDDVIEVEEGLDPGDLVVVKGLTGLKDRMPVRTVEGPR